VLQENIAPGTHYVGIYCAKCGKLLKKIAHADWAKDENTDDQAKWHKFSALCQSRFGNNCRVSVTTRGCAYATCPHWARAKTGAT
jgi:hypothetical protein